MKRSALAVLLAAVAALAPAAAPAHSGVTAGLCQIGGQVAYDLAVQTVPKHMTYTVTGGSLFCLENAQAGAGGASLFGFTGFFKGHGEGEIGCTASQGGGSFTLERPTGTTTRDLWTGTFTNAGGALSLLQASITTIEHQAKSGEIWTTVGAVERPAVSLALGEFVFQVDDPTVCSGAGFTIRDFIGNLVYTYAQP